MCWYHSDSRITLLATFRLFFRNYKTRDRCEVKPLTQWWRTEVFLKNGSSRNDIVFIWRKGSRGNTSWHIWMNYCLRLTLLSKWKLNYPKSKHTVESTMRGLRVEGILKNHASLPQHFCSSNCCLQIRIYQSLLHN